MSLGASDEHEAPNATRNITFQPGVLGVLDIWVQGRVENVLHDTQAEGKGLRGNEYITEVNGNNYSLSGFKRVFSVNQAYTLTVETPPDWVMVLQITLQRMSVPAAAAGCLLALALPWFVYQATRGPSELYPPAVHLLMCIIASHAIGSWGDSMVKNLYSRTLSLISVGETFGHTVGFTGLVLGYCLYTRNPLVTTKLDDDLAPELWKVNVMASMLFVGAVFCKVVACWLQWTLYAQSLASNLPICLYHLREVPTSFGLLAFTLLVSRISLSVRQGFLRIIQGLPCKEHEFLAAVHAPCAELLGDMRAKLHWCGAPLLLVLAGTLSQCFGLYAIVVAFLAPKEQRPAGELIYDASYCAHWALVLVACFVAIFVPLAQVSKGEKELRRGLNKARELNSELHVKLQATEALLDEPKIGLPLWGDLVLTWSLMVSFTVQILLAGTLIKTFFDSQLGMEEAIEKSEDDHFTAEQNQLTILQENLTQLVKLQASLTHLVEEDLRNTSASRSHS